MSTILDNVHDMLPQLLPGEKAQVLQWIARDLCGGVPGIDKTPRQHRNEITEAIRANEE